MKVSFITFPLFIDMFPLNVELYEIYTYIKNLKFTEKPDYDFVIGSFKKLLE